jgi:hypothetical protein
VGRLIILGVGVVGGALGLRRVQRTIRSYTPAGLSERANGWLEAAREFAADVREGMAEREHQLRVALEVDTGAMDEQAARELLENPTAPRRVP